MINIEKIKTDRAVAIVLLTLNIISPGLLGLFFFKNQLFKELDTLKLLLISIALSAPYLVIVFFMCSYFYDQILKVSDMDGDKNGTESNDYNIFLMTGMGASISWIFTGLISLMCYLFINNMSNNSLILISTLVFITISFILLMILNKASK